MSGSLVVARLADMVRTHPLQDNSATCTVCGERVGLYPPAQRALQLRPSLLIVCSRCFLADDA